MLDEQTIARVLGEALGRGGELAEIFVEDRRTRSLRLEASRVEDVSSGTDRGAGIRVIAGDRSSYAHTNLLALEPLLDAAHAARVGLTEGPTPVADLRRVAPGATHPVGIRPDEVETGDKAAALLTADEAARSEGAAVVQVVAS